MNSIELQNVTVSREGQALLQEISWSVPEGQHCVVLGANGSGKTLLLQVVTGYLPPSSGSVTVLGFQHGHCDVRNLRRVIGWVSSSLQDRLHGHDSALDVVTSGKFASIGLWEEPTTQDYAQARECLDFVGCEALSARRYRVLSQGEKQRVLIARALMAQPRLLILDEPCGGLDPAAREHVLRFIEKIGQQPDGPTLIYVTHHIEEIMPVFTHAQLMKAGRTLAQGPCEQVITAELLHRTFEMPLNVKRHKQRYWTLIDGG